MVGFDGSERGRAAVRLGELPASTVEAELEIVQGRSRADRDAREVGEPAAELGVPTPCSDLAPQLRVVAAESPARALHELAEAER